ncbi:MAG: Tyrosine recombinase XerD [Chlamydiia bacterium]|nr:Tyrosine recombinase XerD [Chlamydiia bacterium]
MQEKLDDYLLYLASERGLAKKTLEAYCSDLVALFDFVKSDQITSDQITSDHLLTYFSFLTQEGYQTSSIARKMMAFRGYFQFLIGEEVIDKNPMQLIEGPKIWQLIPDVLTPSEMESILSSTGTGSLKGARDRAIMMVLYASGMRVSELCGLNMVDVGTKQVVVRGKGGKERVTLVDEKTIDAIDHYLSLRGDDREEALFLNQKKKRIGRMAVWSIVKEYAEFAGIEKNVTPHTFRHSFATHLLENGADLRVIQELLGHSSIGTTDRYTHITSSRLQSAFDACHPRKN